MNPVISHTSIFLSGDRKLEERFGYQLLSLINKDEALHPLRAWHKNSFRG